MEKVLVIPFIRYTGYLHFYWCVFDCEDLSPLPFRRERNLSNRNFNKRNSRRRISQQAAEQERHSSTLVSSQPEAVDGGSPPSSSSSSFQLSYSVNSDTESAFNRRSLLKMHEVAGENGGGGEGVEVTTPGDSPTTPPTPDPALLDVRQKVHRFETLKTTVCFMKQERHSLKLLENRRHPSFEDYSGDQRTPPATPPRRIRLPGLGSSRSSSIPSIQSASIHEVRSEDEVDQISDFETDPHATPTEEYVPEDTTSEVIPSTGQEEEDPKTQQQVQRSISADQSKDRRTLPLKMRNDFPR